jgi:acyl-CoA thioesterase FadM
MTLLAALFQYGTATFADRVRTSFRITPLDTGIAKLKSDRYLLLAEAAQIDYLVKTRLLGALIRNGVSFVNASQLIKFAAPIKVFSVVEVDSGIIYWDEKCAYFEHVFSVHGRKCASILVKMKFKKGSKTIAPDGLIGQCGQSKPLSLTHWDEAIHAI